jgi:hypothetical protein
MLQYCAACQSALYCSGACQRKDWKQQHKKICKLLNVGHGDMQVRTDYHTAFSIEVKEVFETEQLFINDGVKRFFKLFEESTFAGSQATAQSMTKFAKRQTKLDKKGMFFHSVSFLVRFSNSEMLSWPSSPLLVMLQFIDPNELFESVGRTSATLLYMLADLADSVDYFTHVNQLMIAKHLIEHGANVNAVSIPHGLTPLHEACFSGNVTNLDFVELLLEESADPNAQDHLLQTPLMCTIPDAPSAARFLMNWPYTDVNITDRSGASFLALVRSTITASSDQIALPGNLDQVTNQFQLQQWRDIEDSLVERDAVDTGIPTL